MDLACVTSNLSCLILASVYVGSFYIWKTNGDRNHPDTVKRRFFSAFCMLFIAPLMVHITLRLITPKHAEVNLILQFGLKWDGVLPAFFLPILLTSILFLGPIMISVLDETETWKDLFSLDCWKEWVQDILWVRNTIVAPISEEFTFRACMLPQLLLCYPASKAILVSPLFFGVGHFHHMAERCRQGMPFLQSLLVSCVQFSYTTLFGTYAAFLFLRTGHLAAPVAAHIFCNVMGFPDFGELVRQSGWRRAVLAASFLLGLICWCFLLWPMTEPSLYSNTSILL